MDQFSGLLQAEIGPGHPEKNHMEPPISMVISYTGYVNVLQQFYTSLGYKLYRLCQSFGIYKYRDNPVFCGIYIYIYIKRGFLENPPIQFDDLPLTRLMTPEGTPLDIPLTITNPLLTRYSAYPLV